MADKKKSKRPAGQRLALIIAATGVIWVLANVIGYEMGWSNRTRALIDLFVLAAFGWCLWIAISLWRNR